MKALQCPSCGAPVTVKKGIALVKCSFCEVDIQTDYKSAEEFSGLEDKALIKLKRRAFDSLKRNLLTKASLQFKSLSELVTPDNGDEYFEIQAFAFASKLKEGVYEAYNLSSGTTVLNIKSQAANASVEAPYYEFTRLDSLLIELIDEIEDKCEDLEEEFSILLAQKSFKCIVEILEKIIIPATEYICNSASFTETEIYSEYGENYYERVAVEEPVFLAIIIRCHMYSMLIKFLELIDIGESEENPQTSLKIHKDTVKYCFSGIRLDHLKLNRCHPAEPYSYKNVQNTTFLQPEGGDAVKDVMDRWNKLNERLKPYFEKNEKIEKEKSQKVQREKKLEDEKMKLEMIRKREEHLASPKYKKQKERTRKIRVYFFWCLGLLVFLLIMF